jgi:hypothetical protein
MSTKIYNRRTYGDFLISFVNKAAIDKLNSKSSMAIFGSRSVSSRLFPNQIGKGVKRRK